MKTKTSIKAQQIKQKALKMFVKEGFDGFSMHKLAKAAGVSPATIYIYFKDKEDLILKLSTEEGKRMVDITLKDFDPAMSFSDGLRVQWMNRAKYCLKYPDRMFFLEQIRHSPFYGRYLEISGNSFRNIMTTFVTNAIEKNELVKVPVEVYWSVAFAPLYNLVRFHIAGTSVGGGRFTFSDKIMNETLNLVLKALKP